MKYLQLTVKNENVQLTEPEVFNEAILWNLGHVIKSDVTSIVLKVYVDLFNDWLNVLDCKINPPQAFRDFKM